MRWRALLPSTAATARWTLRAARIRAPSPGAAFDTYKLVLGCNAPMVSKDENDLPIVTMLDEHNVAAFNKVYSMMSDKGQCGIP